MDNPDNPDPILALFSASINEYTMLRNRIRLVQKQRARRAQLMEILLRMLDDEEELCRIQFIRHTTGRGVHRTIWKHKEVKGVGIWEISIPDLTVSRFRDSFRLRKEIFDELVLAVAPYFTKRDTVFRKAIPVDKRVAIALTMLKTSVDMGLVSLAFGVGRSTVGDILHEFCEIISQHFYKSSLHFPKTNDEKQKNADRFFERWQFPNAYASVDGTHIPIKSPPLLAKDYYNYKEYYSIALLAAVDADGLFIYANVGRPGSCNDSLIFRECALKKLILDESAESKFHIIGDGAFPLMEQLMKPYLIHAKMSEVEKNFNRRLSRARVAVEDAFGRLKGRWRVLLKLSEFSVEHTVKIVETCLFLHNLAESRREPFRPVWKLKPSDIKYKEVPQPEDPTHKTNPAKYKRDILAKMLYEDCIKIV